MVSVVTSVRKSKTCSLTANYKINRPAELILFMNALTRD